MSYKFIWGHLFMVIADLVLLSIAPYCTSSNVANLIRVSKGARSVSKGVQDEQ
jgi:hypothetical protein